jgi:ADP-L-glycero-D-manno-heptose 6-epimerase
LNGVLVTGSKGFIGKNLSNHLSQIEQNVQLIDADYFQDEDWKRSLLNFLEKCNPKAVFHVGACSNTLESNVQLMMEQNYESTKLISNWCNEKKRKLIYSSSAANYGAGGKYPSNLYGWSKYVAEDYVCKNGGVSLRYFNVYGPGEESKGVMSSFLYQSYINMNQGNKVILFPGGPSRDFVYITDVVDANVYALENFPKLAGGCYDVATGYSRQFEEVLNLAGIEFSYAEDVQIPSGYQFYTCGDPEKWMPGWKPNYFLEDGVIEYMNYLQKSQSS